MNGFIKKIILFFSILAMMIAFLAMLPPTPRASQSLLFSKIRKDSLLRETPSPRILFVGGSNLSFGLNSKMIKDALALNPVNTGVHASIGLIYMMDSARDFIRPGDVVVVSPEYNQFYGDYAYGGEELLRTVIDVRRSDIVKLHPRQIANIIRFVPKYAFSKLKPSEYFNYSENVLYGVKSFNEYGDADRHWQMKRKKFKPYRRLSGGLNCTVIDEMKRFREYAEKKNAQMVIAFPGLQSKTFAISRKEIQRIEASLRHEGFLLLGSPERYIIPDDMVFNTPYHLLKSGVDLRTKLLIEDLQKTRDSKIACEK